MFHSAGIRFLIVGALVLVMVIPLFFVGQIIDSRNDFSRQSIATVGGEWGGRQLINGPMLVIPVEAEVTTTKRRDIKDPVTGLVARDLVSGAPLYEDYDETSIVQRDPVYLYPNDFDVSIATQTQERHRGIFRVPVYSATAELAFDFQLELVEPQLTDGEVLLWDQAEIRVGLRSNHALRGDTNLRAGTEEISLEPLLAGSGVQGGIRAITGKPADAAQFTLSMAFNGAETLHIAPVGRQSRVTMDSDWAHPSFRGAFLPDQSEISEAGFSASWTIPHLARNLPQVSRTNHEAAARQNTSFGVEFFQPNDFYQKAYRAAAYAILFIALTFLSVLLIEDRARPTHPVQYLLIGMAQSIFVLLMVAYAEQIGFGAAYAVSSAATIGLLVMFGAVGLKLGRRVWVLGALLIVLYTVLYFILQSADYALLAGATLAFAALAATMFATRNERWFGAPVAAGGPAATAKGKPATKTKPAG